MASRLDGVCARRSFLPSHGFWLDQLRGDHLATCPRDLAVFSRSPKSRLSRALSLDKHGSLTFRYEVYKCTVAGWAKTCPRRPTRSSACGANAGPLSAETETFVTDMQGKSADERKLNREPQLDLADVPNEVISNPLKNRCRGNRIPWQLKKPHLDTGSRARSLWSRDAIGHARPLADQLGQVWEYILSDAGRAARHSVQQLGQSRRTSQP